LSYISQGKLKIDSFSILCGVYCTVDMDDIFVFKAPYNLQPNGRQSFLSLSMTHAVTDSLQQLTSQACAMVA